MKQINKLGMIITLLFLLNGCGEVEKPKGDSWKGIFNLSTKGEQEVETFFDFEKNTGILLMPDVIPIPLELSEVYQKGDSIFFTIGFRSGPAYCKGALISDTIQGIMVKDDIENSSFWLATSTESASIYNLPKPAINDPMVIKTHKNSITELDTKKQLEALLQQYDVEPYLYTKEILIQDSTIPHSHPILTISTRYATEELLLSTFIHEQMHWYSLHKNEAFEALMTDIKEKYPTVPTAMPEGGGSEEGTYMHIAINYLEYKGLKELVGEEKANGVLEYLKNHHYTWIYETVEKDYAQLEELFEQHEIHITF